MLKYSGKKNIPVRIQNSVEPVGYCENCTTLKLLTDSSLN